VLHKFTPEMRALFKKEWSIECIGRGDFLLSYMPAGRQHATRYYFFETEQLREDFILAHPAWTQALTVQR
jgi:hypothetical protein